MTYTCEVRNAYGVPGLELGDSESYFAALFDGGISVAGGHISDDSTVGGIIFSVDIIEVIERLTGHSNVRPRNWSRKQYR